jgi:pyridoxine/pyridoxamine 5'-phosphate oxidase
VTAAREPTASRPGFAPGYGIPEDEEGMLPWSFATERLEAARNYWIVTAAADGRPHAAPVWGLWLDGAVLFGTSPASRKGRNLARNPRVLIHLESGDEVVILEGEVDRAPVDERTADVYEAKYDYRPPGEELYRLRPRVAYAWVERDYPTTVTRFGFD